MTTFAYELAALLAAQDQAHPGDPEGPYAMPWYLVLGHPGTGRSTAIKALNLSWPRGDGPLAMNVPAAQCSYWMPEKAVFIEPEAAVAGPSRQPGLLQELCIELKTRRPREPIDGIVLVISAATLADATEDGVDDYAKALRRQLVEVMQQLAAEVPVYVVVTQLDTLWGFGDVFQWTAERRDEEPWGFSLPPGVPSADTPARIDQELEALNARLESMCFAKLSSEAPHDERTRAFQHLSEIRDVVARLRAFMRIVAMGNAFESSPWIRALALGSGLPGTGQRLRHGLERFTSMGLMPPGQSGTRTPGGMPFHAYLDLVLLPERDLVPTRVRWRDDKLTTLFFMLGGVTWLGIIIIIVAQYAR